MTNAIKLVSNADPNAEGEWVIAPGGFDCKTAAFTYDLDSYLAMFAPQGMRIVDWTSQADEGLTDYGTRISLKQPI